MILHGAREYSLYTIGVPCHGRRGGTRRKYCEEIRMERLRALVVGADSNARASIRAALSERGVQTRFAGSRSEAIEALKSGSLEILLIDFATAGVEPVEFVRYALGLRPAPVVVGLSSGDDSARVAEFVRTGGFDVISAPHAEAQIALLADRATRQLEQVAELQRLRQALQDREGHDRLVGRSPDIQRILDRLESLCHGEKSIWISGERGTGKELTARTIHASSPRGTSPFVLVRCAELATVPSEDGWLLADAGGSSTDPFARSGGGTLYLEEVSALPIELQERLLQSLSVLSAREGSEAVLLIAGTVGDAAQQIERGTLLEALRRLLSGNAVALPRLRDRVDDIPLLARHFISSIVQINQLQPMQISAGALSRLQRYNWPGNVRELRNAIEHAVILAADGTLEADDLPDWVRETRLPPASSRPGPIEPVRRFRDAKREVVDTFESAYLRTLLEHHAGNVTSAAQESGMLRSALQRLLRKHGLKSVSFRTSRPVAPPRTDSEEIRLD